VTNIISPINTSSGTAAIYIPKAAELPVLTLDPDHLAKRKIIGFDSRDIRSRAFNLLRSQVTKRLSQDGMKVLGITSAAPNAGKSFISINLAAALSRMDREVYLFDFDLRRGSIARELGLQSGRGLGLFLEGKVPDLRDVGHRVGETGFAFFPCFASMDRSAELFAGDSFKALAAAMRALPDNAIVLCDLPPAFANDDTSVICEHLDAFLMVVEQGITTRKQILATRTMLDPTPCLGTVLNRYDGGWSDPYGYGYGNPYGKYYASRDLP
jgi:protein-tyrosine kinase